MNICAYGPCAEELPSSTGRGRPRKYCSTSHATLSSRARDPEAYRAYQRDYQRDYQDRYRRENRERRLLNGAWRRAKEHGREFAIVLEDIVIPEVCPILGIKLECAAGNKSCAANSPVLDRIDNERGYVPGNINVISNKANAMKADKTIQQLADGVAGPQWQRWARKRLGLPPRVVTGARRRSA